MGETDHLGSIKMLLYNTIVTSISVSLYSYTLTNQIGNVIDEYLLNDSNAK